MATQVEATTHGPPRLSISSSSGASSSRFPLRSPTATSSANSRAIPPTNDEAYSSLRRSSFSSRRLDVLSENESDYFDDVASGDDSNDDDDRFDLRLTPPTPRKGRDATPTRSYEHQHSAPVASTSRGFPSHQQGAVFGTNRHAQLKRPVSLRRTSSSNSSPSSPVRRTRAASHKGHSSARGKASVLSTAAPETYLQATLKSWSFVVGGSSGGNPRDRLAKGKGRADAPAPQFYSMIPFWTPSLQPLFVLAVSGIATCTVALFLVAGFALTAFDDIGRNISLVHSQLTLGSAKARDTIEDVKVGVARVLDTARGTAVWATGAQQQSQKTPPASRRPSVDDDNDEYGAKARAARPSTRRHESQKSSASSSPSRSSRGRTSTRSSFDHGSSSTGATSNIDGWESDDDYDVPHVPHSTPFTSRPASPTRNHASSKHQSNSHNSKQHHPPPPQFPPRPRLSVLIPSIIVALLFTTFRLLRHVWLSRNEKVRSRAN